MVCRPCRKRPERDPARGLQRRDAAAQQPVVADHALDEQPDPRTVRQVDVEHAGPRQGGGEQQRLLVEAQTARVRRAHEPEVGPVGVEQRLGRGVEDVDALVVVHLVADEPDVAAVRRERGRRLVAEARHESTAGRLGRARTGRCRPSLRARRTRCRPARRGRRGRWRGRRRRASALSPSAGRSPGAPRGPRPNGRRRPGPSRQEHPVGSRAAARPASHLPTAARSAGRRPCRSRAESSVSGPATRRPGTARSSRSATPRPGSRGGFA